ncbi:NADPH-dependent glutamate synthase beta chain [Lutibacter oricola]|uniref:NADPH-dependent glutamate synthase beta chain n=1 Tax=Lutibacter oricola TaxID=762486 RepID=A0A1H3CJY6_9FLAO|nr:NAD(P)-binding protein [Lutibacter oricola]SDX54310.1 NADPH-dependent glutamate synthase beta chain [Lutibacter oricola]
MSLKSVREKHHIAIIGGAVSGSVAANILANNGFRVVVFEMNNLPYGKIEDGLPNWHVKLRNRQIEKIDKNLNHPSIIYLPNTKIGKDISFLELINNWSFSGVIIANGAWNDRQFPIPQIGKFINKELVYQNDFIYWFNHKHEPNYNGNNYFIKNNAVVLGGGLASLDVIKIVMIELVRKQLWFKKGIKVDMFTLEHKGVRFILETYKTSLKELEIEKAKLVYRKTAKDMPLKTAVDNSIESIEAARLVSEKLLNKYKNKYMFEFIPLSVPVSFVEKNNKLTGLILQKRKIDNGKIILFEGDQYKINTSFVISSIGSLPEKIEGLPYDNTSLKIAEGSNCLVDGFDNVFAIGNAVTGRGNIQESSRHSKKSAFDIIDAQASNDKLEKWLTSINIEIEDNVNEQLPRIINGLKVKEIKPKKQINDLYEKVNLIHKKQKFTSYLNWVFKKTPIRLEETLKK